MRPTLFRQCAYRCTSDSCSGERGMIVETGPEKTPRNSNDNDQLADSSRVLTADGSTILGPSAAASWQRMDSVSDFDTLLALTMAAESCTELHGSLSRAIAAFLSGPTFKMGCSASPLRQPSRGANWLRAFRC